METCFRDELVNELLQWVMSHHDSVKWLWLWIIPSWLNTVVFIILIIIIMQAQETVDILQGLH